MPIRICCGDLEQLKSDDAWLIIVDLGFSGSDKTTGVLVKGDMGPKDYKFGVAVEEVAKAVKKAAEEKKAVNLVLEAPLSYAFDKEGNPALRVGEQSKGEHRGWYHGPGATTALAAMFFLRNLVSQLNSGSDVDICIYLYEGFLSYKDDTTDHAEDCKALLEAIESATFSKNVKEGSKPSILEVLNLGNGVEIDAEGAPLIIFANAPS